MLKKNGLCKTCNVVKPRSLFALHKGTNWSRGICKDCSRKRLKKRVLLMLPYRLYKKDYCEMCGFKGLTCQLDINHKDMNHKNNEVTNLETLCANCHRLVTFMIQRNQSKY